MRIQGSTKVVAVIGDPVSHSLSPLMHNTAFAVLGLDAVYVAWPTTPGALPHVLRAFEATSVAGNITVPHKIAASQLIVRKSDIAKQLDAINTFWADGSRLVGDNTDVAGIAHGLEQVDAEGPWLLAGTGGSARAVVGAAASAGVRLLIRSRQAMRARDFVDWCKSLGVDARVDDGRSVGTAINTTPLGMNVDDAHPIPAGRLDGCRAVLDLVYRPGETLWCRDCRARGMRAIDGRVVLVEQGAQALERFFPGVEAPRQAMRGVVEGALS